jgi:hypothetical protein
MKIIFRLNKWNISEALPRIIPFTLAGVKAGTRSSLPVVLKGVQIKTHLKYYKSPSSLFSFPASYRQPNKPTIEIHKFMDTYIQKYINADTRIE